MRFFGWLLGPLFLVACGNLHQEPKSEPAVSPLERHLGHHQWILKSISLPDDREATPVASDPVIVAFQKGKLSRVTFKKELFPRRRVEWQFVPDGEYEERGNELIRFQSAEPSVRSIYEVTKAAGDDLDLRVKRDNHYVFNTVLHYKKCSDDDFHQAIQPVLTQYESDPVFPDVLDLSGFISRDNIRTLLSKEQFLARRNLGRVTLLRLTNLVLFNRNRRLEEGEFPREVWLEESIPSVFSLDKRNCKAEVHGHWQGIHLDVDFTLPEGASLNDFHDCIYFFKEGDPNVLLEWQNVTIATHRYSEREDANNEILGSVRSVSIELEPGLPLDMVRKRKGKVPRDWTIAR